MPFTLAIETSGTVGSIALSSGGECLEERELQLGRQHGQTLIPELHKLLADHGRKPADCRLVAVSVGPGSFTGLRVGIVCAKVFAFATGCQVASVGTFLAIACNAPVEVSNLDVIGDAQRDDLFLGRFRRNEQGEWEQCERVRIVNASEYASSLPAGATLAGAGIDKIAQSLDGSSAKRLSPEFWRPRAAQVARLGDAQVEAGGLTDAWSLEPLYVRKSAAEEKWEERHP